MATPAKITHWTTYPFAVIADTDNALFLGFFLDDSRLKEGRYLQPTPLENNFHRMAPRGYQDGYYTHVLILNTSTGVKAFDVSHGYSRNHLVQGKIWNVRYNYTGPREDCVIYKAVKERADRIYALPMVDWTEEIDTLVAGYGRNILPPE